MSRLKGVSLDPTTFSKDSGVATLDEMAALAESGVIIGDFSIAERTAALTAQEASFAFSASQDRPEPLGEAAYHGLVGEIVRKIEPETEADPAGILLQTLVGLGNVIGRGSHFQVESTRHHLNLNVVLVGETSKSRKGTSFDRAIEICRGVDPAWVQDNIKSGLSSGEGLIFSVRDPISQDPGVRDKRLLIVEAEFSSPLKVMERPGNNLSPVIRLAWDHGNLQILNKNSPAKATGAHVSIIGHITREELLKSLKSSQAGTGFANRFLYCWVNRTQCLPEGGNIPEDELAPLIAQLKENVEIIKSFGDVQIEFGEEARALWRRIYPALSSGKPGLSGAVTARGEAQTVRLASLYAVLDLSLEIEIEHLKAALELWRFCEASARHIFGDKTGEPIADEILAELRSISPEALTRTDMNNLLGGRKKTAEISLALNLLKLFGLARREIQITKGRPLEVWFAT